MTPDRVNQTRAGCNGRKGRSQGMGDTAPAVVSGQLRDPLWNHARRRVRGRGGGPNHGLHRIGSLGLAVGCPLVGSIGVWFTIFFTFPAFTLYLVGLRLARRWWPRRVTAWILTPLLTWTVLWTWPADGEGSLWIFGIALVCVAAAAALVRI